MNLQCLVKLSKAYYNSVDVQDVFVGPADKDLRALRIEFEKEVLDRIGPQPPKPEMIQIVHEGNVYKVEDNAQAKVRNDWFQKYGPATNDARWTEWLCSRHGFFEIERIEEL